VILADDVAETLRPVLAVERLISHGPRLTTGGVGKGGRGGGSRGWRLQVPRASPPPEDHPLPPAEATGIRKPYR